MKKKGRSLHYITLIVFCQLFSFITPVSALDTDNFYFESFDADYYLEKNKDGVSTLRVVENLTAVFPDYNQNKGICRMIPYLNQGGKNRTLDSLGENDIKVLRNGVEEPIYSIEKTKNNYYEVCTGDDDYILGRQVFTFEYTFSRVVTTFHEDEKQWQELYWNTNGTGWYQRFDALTARVHFEDENVWTGGKWCYVGEYGRSGQNRCEVSKSEDGKTITFKTSNLKKGENLTFALELKPDSFRIPDPEKSYLALFVMGGIALVFGLFLIGPIKRFFKTSEKRKFYKNYFIKPEYQPNPQYPLLEAAAVYLGKAGDPKVALLLQMVIEGKIQLIKGEKKTFGGYKWSIKVLSEPNLQNGEETILKLLNGGNNVSVGSTIEIKKRQATHTLKSMGEAFDEIGPSLARKDRLMSKKSSSSPALSALGFIIFFAFVVFAPFLETLEVSPREGVVYVGSELLKLAIFLIVAGFITIRLILSSKTKNFEIYDKSGLELSRYMDGLKLYIKMAEKDRLSFLQSVEGADTSPAGVVKLYEKLLPYAALFGVEDSWMKELEKYYQLAEVPDPTWHTFNDSFTIHEIGLVMSNASSYIASSTHYIDPASSSGGSSFGGGSSFSGGGGGGFSGGGGGGGGGHGR